MRKGIRYVVALLLLVFGAQSAHAQGIDHYNLALTFEGQKNWTKAFDQMLKAAEGGNAEAQFRVANYYLEGQGTPSDRAKAIEWLERAAVSGNDSAALHLAEAYSLWVNYRDVNKAKHWIAEVAKHKNKETLLLLGDCAQSIDMRQAIVFYTEAMNAGVAEAAFRLSNIYISPKASDGSPNEFVDTLKAVSMCKVSAEMGYTDAQWLLAQIYAYGMGVEKNMEQSNMWLKKAAENGLAVAQYWLARLYDSQGNPEERDKWLYRSAQQGEPKACVDFAAILNQEGDSALATAYYLKAAEAGDAVAQYLVGKAYFKGKGVKQDYTKAFYWFGEGAKQNNVNCLYNYGAMMSLGSYYDVPMDIKRGRELLTVAKTMGHQGAAELLSDLEKLREKYRETYKK